MKRYFTIHNILLMAIIVVAIVTRFWQLGNIPGGIVDDEAKYIYSAYSVWKTGADITGKFLPLSFNLDTSLSPVPVYLISPFVGMLGLSALTGRMLMALSGVGSVILLYWLTKKLVDNSWISLLAAFSLAISPWDILISRSAFEANLALFFYLLAIATFITMSKRGNINWSLPAFLLAFYSYHATKVFFLLCIPLLMFIYRKELLLRRKELLIFCIGCLSILFSFFLIMKVQGVSRGSELFWNNDRIAYESTLEVNNQRQRSVGSPLLKKVYNNKALYDLDLMVTNYLHAYSFQILFTKGEGSFIAGNNYFFHGALYLSELLLLVLGMFYLALSRMKESSFVVLGLLLIAPFPTLVSSGPEYLLRSVMMLPILCILIGCGYYLLFTFVKKHLSFLYLVALGIFILGHVFLISRFFYQYFNQFGNYGGEFWQKSNKDLSLYIAKNEGNYATIYTVQTDYNFPLAYAIYNRLEPKYIQKIWSQTEKRNMGKIHYLPDCLNNNKGDPAQFLAKNTLYIVPSHCHTKIKPMDKIVDSFEPLHVIWKIYEKK